MFPNRTPVQRLALLALVATAGCTDSSRAPTAPTGASAIAAPNAQANVAQKPIRGEVISFTSLSINPTVFTIGVTPGTWTAVISNPQKKGVSNLVIQTYFAVYNLDGSLAARRASGGSLLNCPGRSYGYLPGGGCTTTGTATPSNSGPGAFLVPDDNTHDARFEIELIQDQGTPTQKLLAKGSTDVTLFYQLN